MTTAGGVSVEDVKIETTDPATDEDQTKLEERIAEKMTTIGGFAEKLAESDERLKRINAETYDERIETIRTIKENAE